MRCTSRRDSSTSRLRALFVVVALVVVAACGGDDEGGSGGNNSGGNGNGNGATPSEGLGETEGAMEAIELIERISERPTEVGVDTPIEADIPSGKSVYYVSCGPEACTEAGRILEVAGEILGWDVTVLDTDGTPQGIAEAFSQVVRAEPDGVYYKAIPRSQIGEYLDQLEELGTVVVNDSLIEPPEPPVIWSTFTPEHAADVGEAMAAWVVFDAVAAGVTPEVVYVDLPEFSNLEPMATAFDEGFTRFCDGCTFRTLDVALQDITNLPDLVVSHLRANPGTQYIVMSVDSIGTGIPAALGAAGLAEDVKIFGNGPGTQNLEMIASEEQAGSLPGAFYEMTFGALDAIARHLVGEEILDPADPPLWLVTSENLPTSSEFFPLVVDVEDHFRALWGKD